MMPREITWDGDKISRLWDYYAKNAAYYPQYFSYHSGAYILDHIKRYVALHGNILDFGCGPGFLIQHLLARMKKGRIFGLDFSKESIAHVNQKNRDHPYFGEALWTRTLPSPYASESMDIIICVEVIEHLNDTELQNMFLEVNRLLKWGGIIILTTPNEENLAANKTICPECGCIFHRWQHVRSWHAEGLRTWLERHRFRPVVIQPLHFQSRKERFVGRCFSVVRKVFGKSPSSHLPHLLAIAEKDG